MAGSISSCCLVLLCIPLKFLWNLLQRESAAFVRLVLLLSPCFFCGESCPSPLSVHLILERIPESMIQEAHKTSEWLEPALCPLDLRDEVRDAHFSQAGPARTVHGSSSVALGRERGTDFQMWLTGQLNRSRGHLWPSLPSCPLASFSSRLPMGKQREEMEKGRARGVFGGILSGSEFTEGTHA